MDITCLCENTPYSDGLAAEHGLSLYIEHKQHRLLFDAGQTDVFIRNAEQLGIDLSAVDIAVLSHGHYDHSGGLARFLECNTQAKIYLSRHAFGAHYNAADSFIGIDPALRESGRIVTVDDHLRLGESIELFSGNNRELAHPIDSAGLYLIQDDIASPDTFLHEQYLKITDGERVYLISGCSHKGILNIRHWFAPDVLIGGFHFMKQAASKDNPTLQAAARELLRGNTVYYTGHCTGVPQYGILKEMMGERLHYLASGEHLQL